MKPEILGSPNSLPAEVKLVDALDGALLERYFIEHPEIDKRSLSDEQISALSLPHTRSVWAYYPDRRVAVHIPDEATTFALKTARNRNLITADEQAAFRASRIGIAGLSVGSTVFSTLVQIGGPKNMKIADPDTVELTNLNRMRATLLDVGKNKTDVAAQSAWELDPFLELELWREGILENTLRRFLLEPRLDVFVDEMDSISLKVRSRIECRKEHIPVVMATDNGDGIILDIERFDLEPERPIFHGRVNIDPETAGSMDRAAFVQLANEIIDPVMFTPRQWESIQNIGKKISGVPQLSSAVAMAGAAAAFAVRQIVTESTLPSGRYLLNCEDMLQAGVKSGL